jgi:putative DNA primase/helicase
LNFLSLGGSHIVLTVTRPIRNAHGKIAPGIDIKGDGGYIVVEPSTTASSYEWLDWSPIDGEVPQIDPCPAWLENLLTPRTSPQMTVVTGSKVIDGSRNNTLTKLAGMMRRKGFEADAIEAALAAHNAKHCSPPLDSDEVSKIARSVARYSAQPESTQDVAPFDAMLDRTKTGGVKANLNNASILLSAPAEMQTAIGYNEFSLNIEAIAALPWRKPGVWSENDAAYASIWLSRTYGVDFSTDRIMEAVSVIAANAPFHPIRNEVLSAQWDKTPRLDFWMEDAFGVGRTKYHQAVGRKWIIGMVARVFSPGCKLDTMPVLEGEQGEGKSSAIEALAGSDNYTTLTVSPDNKDFMVGMRSSWLIELAELDSFKRSDETTIKAMLSIHTDSYRAPYGRTVQKYPRQCIFVGTTNRFQWNEDETGGRRFWPIRVKEINLSAIKSMRLQLLAEAYEAFLRKEDWWTVPADEARIEQDKRFVVDSWEEVIAEWLAGKNDSRSYQGIDFVNGGGVARASTTQIASLALQIPIERHSRSVQTRIGSVMKRLEWNKTRHQSEARIYVRPTD